ncbi:MAG: biotin-dependent carboxyltransferase family protein [Gemmataceae bacterium]
MSLRVSQTGLYTIIVDMGRPRTRSLGVPVGGAADRAALAIGNALVGNPPEAAALEVCLAGPTLEAETELACVVYGAPFDLFSPRQALTTGTTFTLEPGEQLRIGGTAEGMRAYLCVQGGITAPRILDSRSGLAPVQAGDVLPCAPGRIGRRFIRVTLPSQGKASELRVLAGPQADWFAGEEFYRQTFIVTKASNRMGLRLQGNPLTMPARELLSEPVCPGAVQVTNNGQCIILGVDGQTIGGYPKIAQVISADLDQLGQLRPETPVRFVPVTLAEAEQLFQQRQAEWSVWTRRLLLADAFAR